MIKDVVFKSQEELEKYLDSDDGIVDGRVHFDNCTFNFIVNFQEEIDVRFFITNCTFYENVSFKYFYVKERVQILNTIFKKNISFHFSKFYKNFSFSNTKCDGICTFIECSFYDGFNFTRNHLYDAFKLMNCNFNIKTHKNNAITKFDTIEFHTDFFFIDNTVTSPISFENSHFKRNAFFTSSNFEHYVTFIRTIFYSSTYFGYGLSITGFFDKEDFLSYSPIMTSLSFKKHVSFKRQCSFSQVKFFKVNFEGGIDLTNANINKEIQFITPHFKQKANFTEVDIKEKGLLSISDGEFEGSLHLTKTKCQGEIKLLNSRLKNTIYLDNINAIKGKILLKNLNLSERIIFDFSNIGNLCLRSISTDKEINFLDLTFRSNDHETYRIVKDQFLKQNNKVEALKYYSLEMEAYSKQLGKEKAFSKNKPILISFKEFLEYILLTLNRFSNSYGLSWGRGIVFFLVTTILIFTCFICSLEEVNFERLWPALTNNQLKLFFDFYPRFINPAHNIRFLRTDLLENAGYHLGHFSVMIDYFGRVVSAYGIYQIIQAFRKYGKG